MKKALFGCILLSFMAVLNTSCLKEDDADAFVGTYYVTAITTATSGGSSYSYSSNSTLNIRKVSANRVQTSGWFSTYGNVIGNTVYFDSYSCNESDFRVTYSFNAGLLNGNVLSVSDMCSGSSLHYGTWYPYYSTTQHTCVKQ